MNSLTVIGQGFCLLSRNASTLNGCSSVSWEADLHPSHYEMSLKCLKQISIERDISKTSQKDFKRDVFFETSLRRLKYISKKIFFCEVFETSQIHLKKDAFFVTSLRRLRYFSDISQKRCLFSDNSNISQKYILKVFVTIQKYHTKMVSCW